MKVIVIGGVAGGPSFATRLRRLNEADTIIMIERGPDISYASCALPYYLGGVIDERETLIERTPAGLATKNNLDVRVNSEVTTIEPQQHTVTIKSEAGSRLETYDKLVLATGARPTLPPIPGISEVTNGFGLRSVADADQIKAFMHDYQPQRITIIGAGAAGLELAENFTAQGLQVTLVEQNSHVATPLDPEIATVLEQTLVEHHVGIHLGIKVSAISEGGRQLKLSNGETLATDMIIFATGVRPNNEVAAAAGVTLTDDGHIPVNDQFMTNVPDIYAIGDVIETTSLITGQPIASVLSSAANRQGHLLADIINGSDDHYPGFVGANVAKVFNLTVSSVGYTEQSLAAAGIQSGQSVMITPFSHAYFYPGAARVNFKLVYDGETGQIYGGQAVGEDGVDKRISQLSVAISAKMTVADLPNLEIPYSPPFSSTRDVLNIAGYVALNQMANIGRTVKLSALSEAQLAQATILDVREAGRQTMGHVPATAWIPLSQLRDRLAELPTNQPVYLTYRPGLSNYNAARILAAAGIEASIIDELGE